MLLFLLDKEEADKDKACDEVVVEKGAGAFLPQAPAGGVRPAAFVPENADDFDEEATPVDVSHARSSSVATNSPYHIGKPERPPFFYSQCNPNQRSEQSEPLAGHVCILPLDRDLEL